MARVLYLEYLTTSQYAFLNELISRCTGKEIGIPEQERDLKVLKLRSRSEPISHRFGREATERDQNIHTRIERCSAHAALHEKFGEACPSGFISVHDALHPAPM